jgi:hypothetical protein
LTAAARTTKRSACALFFIPNVAAAFLGRDPNAAVAALRRPPNAVAHLLAANAGRAKNCRVCAVSRLLGSVVCVVHLYSLKASVAKTY